MLNEEPCETCIHFKLCKDTGRTNAGIMSFCKHYQLITQQERDLKDFFGNTATPTP